MTMKIIADTLYIYDSQAPITTIYLNEGKVIEGSLHIECPHLTTLPCGLIITGNLSLVNCQALESLPLHTTVRGMVKLDRCPSLITIPATFKALRGFWFKSTQPSSFRRQTLGHRPGNPVGNPSGRIRARTSIHMTGKTIPKTAS